MIFEPYDRIVFAGDSVTDMGSDQPVGEGLFDSLGNGYVRAVENLLSAFYPELPLRITNAGTAGNNSRDLLARFSVTSWICTRTGCPSASASTTSGVSSTVPAWPSTTSCLRSTRKMCAR